MIVARKLIILAVLHYLVRSKFVNLSPIRDLGLDGSIDAEVEEPPPAGLVFTQVVLQALDVLDVHRIIASINISDAGMMELGMGSAEDGNAVPDTAPHGSHSVIFLHRWQGRRRPRGASGSQS